MCPTPNRSYRDAFSWQKALNILEEESGTVVDPALCQTFVALVNRLYERNPKAFDVIGTSDSDLNLAGDV